MGLPPRLENSNPTICFCPLILYCHPELSARPDDLASTTVSYFIPGEARFFSGISTTDSGKVSNIGGTAGTLEIFFDSGSGLADSCFGVGVGPAGPGLVSCSGPVSNGIFVLQPCCTTKKIRKTIKYSEIFPKRIAFFRTQ